MKAKRSLRMQSCGSFCRKKDTPAVISRVCGNRTKSAAARSSIAAYLMMATILSLSSQSINAQFQTCFSQLSQADSNRDDVLSQDEYATAVSLLSWGSVDSAYENLPAELQDTFSHQLAGGSSGIDIEGARQNGTASTSQQTNLGLLCSEMFIGILAAGSVEMTQQQCFIAMAIGDTNRDDFLAKTIEFPRFANQISGGKYGYTVTFYSLPEPVQQIFGDFATVDDQINVTGSKPGESIDTTQQFFLNSLCNQTAVAVLAVQTQNETTSATAAPAHTFNPAPSPSVSTNSSLSFDDCTTAMALSDLDRDDVLSQLEYLRFLNRLTNSKYADTTFNSLPEPLQENYNNLANGDGNIDVAGSKPGQTPDDSQVANLENVCAQTGTALQNANGGEASPSVHVTPTPAPIAQPTSPPDSSGVTILFTKCKQDMLISDVSRDDMLDQAEYVRFVSRNDGNVDATGEFEALPTALKDNFFSLVDENGSIPIAGSKPGQTATDAEVTNLERVCTETAMAIESSFGASNPTKPPGTNTSSITLNILNAFVMSNTAGLRADSLAAGRNRDALNAGYANFTTIFFDAFMSTARTNRYRRLAVTGLLNGTQQVYRIDDTVCPAYVQNKNSFCQIAYAKFQITAEDEQDPIKLETQISQDAQKAIDDGALESCVEAADPGVSIIVEASADPLVPKNDTTLTPSDNSGAGAEPVGGGGPSAGVVVGILAALSTTVGAGFWYFWRSAGEGTCKIPLFTSSSTSKPVHPSETDDEMVDVMEDIEAGVSAQGQNIFGARKKFSNESTETRNVLSGIFTAADTGITRNDDDSGAGFSVQEQSPEQSRRQQSGPSEKSSNMFGAFGLKKGKRAANSHMNDNPEVFEEYAASQDGAQDDYDNYAFDDPTVMRQDSMGDVFRKEHNEEWDDDQADSGKWGNEWRANQKSGELSNGPESVSGSSGSDEDSRSYDENSGSESGSYVDDDDFTRDSRGNSSYGESPGTSIAVLPESMRHLDSLVDQGDWDGVMAAAANFEVGLRDDRSAPSEKSGSNEEKEDSMSSNSSYSGDDSYPEEDTFFPGEPVDFDEDEGLDHNSGTSLTMTSEELRRRDQYRAQVETLVRKCAPEEIDNVGKMLDQFAGREAELISTLQSMYQRAASQRARKAVHKSRALPERDPRTIMSGGTEGSTAIAAASTIGGSHHDEEHRHGPTRKAFMEADRENMENGHYFDHGRGKSYYNEDDDNAQEGSYDEDEDDDASDYSEGEESGSYDSRERGQVDDDQGSYDDDDQGSYDDDDQGSYDDDNDDQDSYDEEEGSYHKKDQGSYESGEYSDEDSYEED